MGEGKKDGGIVSGEIGAEKVQKIETGPRRIFDGIDTFDGIIDMLAMVPDGSIPQESVLAITKAKGQFLRGEFATNLNHITRREGLRDAVIRALAPSFEEGQSLSEIIARLENAQKQNELLPSAENGGKLSVFTITSGEPIRIADTIEVLKHVDSFLKNNSMNHDRAPIIKQFVAKLRLTSNRGFKKAVDSAVNLALANADTSRIQS